jgi:hypothetical protein
MTRTATPTARTSSPRSTPSRQNGTCDVHTDSVGSATTPRSRTTAFAPSATRGLRLNTERSTLTSRNRLKSNDRKEPESCSY